MLSLLKRKKLPHKDSPVKLNMPIMEEKVALDTEITEEETDIDFSDFREMLKKRNLSVPALFELPKETTKTRTKPILYTEKEGDEETRRDVKSKRLSKMSKNIHQGTITTETAKQAKHDVELKIPSTMIKIGDEEIINRIPERREPVNIKVPTYYMNNREVFTNFINTLFAPYKEELEAMEENLTCEKLTEAKKKKFALLTHQKVVRDYLNLYTPYRGLLLYFGLGAGKTCSSIAIAEGIKSKNTVFVLTPASLRENFISELKVCGDSIYKTNQYWEFVDTKGNPHVAKALSEILSLSLAEIEKQGGAWFIHIKKKANFQELSETDKKSIDNQIDLMIRSKYRFINYNGMRNSHLTTLEEQSINNGGRSNPFDNTVVIIDEVHNFVSRIVNKLGKKDKTLPIRLYEYLMDAENCRLVFLTGTPIINYPNEIAVLFNMLRGYIKTYYFPLKIKTTKKIDSNAIRSILKKNRFIDYIDYKSSTNMLVLTKNPHGFVAKTKRKRTGGDEHDGVYNINNSVPDKHFKNMIISLLSKNNIDVLVSDPNKIKVEKYTCLPDDKEEFIRMFINDNNELINPDLFKRRIIGLTSYYKSAKESLLPRFNPESNIIIEKIEFSDEQLGIYEIARKAERNEDRRNRMKRAKNANGLYDETSSTYRIFSRVFCNFIFPTSIAKRPMPTHDDVDDTKPSGKPAKPKKRGEDIVDEDIADDKIEIVIPSKMDEDDVDGVGVEEKIMNVDGRFTPNDDVELSKSMSENIGSDYASRIEKARNALIENADKVFSKEYLKKYSPKFLSILNKLTSDGYEGTHLIYSQFRTLEGIGILTDILNHNGFAQFKITNKTGVWRTDIKREDEGKPKYALYTGTEGVEEKELMRLIFNSEFDKLKGPLKDDVLSINENNHLGEIIKTIMITTSGAEGITLKNVQHVHIVEPYWHPVRTEQVIGRAVRICSHQDLNEQYKKVDVYIYLMTFSDKQLYGDKTAERIKDREPIVTAELKLKDVSKIDNKTPLTTDEALHEISNIKSEINKNILRAVKEASIDCFVYSKANNKEKLACYNISSPSPNNFNFTPSYKNESTDMMTKLNKEEVMWRGYPVLIEGKKHVLKTEDPKSGIGEVYDYDSYMLALDPNSNVNPVLVGKLVPDPKNKKKTRYVKFGFN